jgi:hypothetical protein
MRNAIGTLVRGAAAGIAGTVVMSVARTGIERASLHWWEQRESEWEHLVRVQARRIGRRPSRSTIRGVGFAVHILYGAAWGALYAAVAGARRVTPRTETGAPRSSAPERPLLAEGLGLGAVCYLANYPRWGVMPVLGVLPPDTERPLRLARIPIATHAVFGVATVAAFRVLRGRAPHGS